MVQQQLVTPELRALIGKTAEPLFAPDDICPSEVRRFAQATLDDNPLWYDVTFARSTRFGTDCAPIPLSQRAAQWWKKPLGSLDPVRSLGPNDNIRAETQGELAVPWPPGYSIVHGGDEFECIRLPRMGERIVLESRLADIYEKTGRSGQLGFAIIERRHVTTAGDVICINRVTHVARPGDRARGAPASTKGIQHDVALASPVTASAQPPRAPAFEEARAGNLTLFMGQVVTIPLMVRWCGATELWRRDHYDSKFSIEHDNLTDAIMSGAWAQAYIWQLLFNWVMPDGWVWKVYLQDRAMTYPGDSVALGLKVTETSKEAGLGFVKVDVGLVKQDSVTAVRGHAVVVLPTRGGPEVPHPFHYRQAMGA